MSVDNSFDDGVAIVTGGATGLGNEVARRLLEAGASVAITTRPGGHTLGAQELIRSFGRERVRSYPCDLADPAAVQDFFFAAAADFGTIRYLVNNAGIWPRGKFEDITTDEWDRTFAVNVRAPFLLCQNFVRQDASGGRIVNVTSQAAFYGSTTGHAHYAASKAALVTMTVSLAREVSDRGITANCVAVGIMNSNMTRYALATDENRYLARIPLGRVAEPTDIAGAVLFLLGAESRYMTGATIDVTGGMLMR